MEALFGIIDKALSRMIDTYRTRMDVLAFSMYKGIENSQPPAAPSIPAQGKENA